MPCHDQAVSPRFAVRENHMSTRAQTSRDEAGLSIAETMLGLISARAPLPTVLDGLCRSIERNYPDLLCSVLLLDADGVTLRDCAAPSLPNEYNAAIDGVKIGPSVGSCGTAAYLKRQVIVADIATDPLWTAYKHLALPHSLRACWSTPITSSGGNVLGTFAVYYRKPRNPESHHLQLISSATHLAVLAIEHDRARAELSAAEARYQSLVERLPAITYIAELGTNGRWHYVSPQIESILGFKPGEWLANPNNWIDHIHPEDRAVAMAAEEEFVRNRKLFFAEYRMFARDGRMLWFRDEAVLLEPNPDQQPMMQGVLYDITEHKNLEDQLRHSQKMEAVGQLAGGIAHDFNNLLMLIQAHNSRLRERLSTSDSEARQDSQQIEQAVIRAAALTRQLLAFSRKQVLRAIVLDLNAVVYDAAKMLERLIEKGVEMQLRLDPGLHRIKADPVQIEQVIFNLAVNARDAMPNGGTLTIATHNAEVGPSRTRDRRGMPPGEYVVLTVSDTGIGMDTSTQAHIFEPFFTTKAPGKGTGLGLATVYGVVQQSGGWVCVTSELGRGATFEIYFPRSADAIETPVAPQNLALPNPSSNNHETILLVEDQDGIRDMAAEFLRRIGYKVLNAEDGVQALEIAAGHPDAIHLLVTDMSMPNMGGRELATSLTQLRPGIPILYMSGHPDHALPSDAGTGSATQVLQKPFALEDMAQKVRSLLDSHRVH